MGALRDAFLTLGARADVSRRPAKGVALILDASVFGLESLFGGALVGEALVTVIDDAVEPTERHTVVFGKPSELSALTTLWLPEVRDAVALRRAVIDAHETFKAKIASDIRTLKALALKPQLIKPDTRARATALIEGMPVQLAIEPSGELVALTIGTDAVPAERQRLLATPQTALAAEVTDQLRALRLGHLQAEDDSGATLTLAPSPTAMQTTGVGSAKTSSAKIDSSEEQQDDPTHGAIPSLTHALRAQVAKHADDAQDKTLATADADEAARVKDMFRLARSLAGMDTAAPEPTGQHDSAERRARAFEGIYSEVASSVGQAASVQTVVHAKRMAVRDPSVEGDITSQRQPVAWESDTAGDPAEVEAINARAPMLVTRGVAENTRAVPAFEPSADADDPDQLEREAHLLEARAQQLRERARAIRARRNDVAHSTVPGAPAVEGLSFRELEAVLEEPLDISASDINASDSVFEDKPMPAAIGLVLSDGRARERLMKHLSPVVSGLVDAESVQQLVDAKGAYKSVIFVRPASFDDVATLKHRPALFGRAKVLVLSSDPGWDGRTDVALRLPLGERAGEVAGQVLDGLKRLGALNTDAA